MDGGVLEVEEIELSLRTLHPGLTRMGQIVIESHSFLEY